MKTDEDVAGTARRDEAKNVRVVINSASFLTLGRSWHSLTSPFWVSMQERAHGGLAPAIKRRLRVLAAEVEANGAGAFAPALLLKPGTRLLREWGGKTHTVIVLDDGFEYDGERHHSLTQIARRITGAHWSGPRFFGLGKAAVQT
jgi:hypothetical protein